ncbi:hypothetical protein [Kitasatospora griseola]|uniref:hypothetical protein n=1 Tax=Kitasatospora griseola TaxID=2064 RepID=UPI003826D4B7
MNLAQCLTLPEESEKVAGLLQSTIQAFRSMGSGKNELEAIRLLAALHRTAGRADLAAQLHTREQHLATRLAPARRRTAPHPA